jgi:hypothetical protein
VSTATSIAMSATRKLCGSLMTHCRIPSLNCVTIAFRPQSQSVAVRAARRPAP